VDHGDNNFQKKINITIYNLIVWWWWNII